MILTKEEIELKIKEKRLRKKKDDKNYYEKNKKKISLQAKKKYLKNKITNSKRCLKCDAIISFGGSMCKSCSSIGKKHSDATKQKIAISMQDPKRKELCRLNQKKALKAIKEKSLKKFLDGNPTLKIGKRGYLMVYIPELADYKFKKGWRYYHHYIWENFNNKSLLKGYCIHHKDGDKLNNLIQNLQLMKIDEHDKISKKTKKTKDI